MRAIVPGALRRSCWLLSVGTLAGLVACVPRFEQPAPNEPHAVVKLRVVYHSVLDVQLSEAIRFNGLDVALDRSSRAVGVAVTRAIRVPPASSAWSFETVYSHMVQRLRTQYVSEQYSCGTETVGYGQYRSTRTRQCTRQVPRQQWVSERVVDDTCLASAHLFAQVGHVYVMQYDYLGSGRCSMRCMEQLSTGPGTFRLAPCP